MPLIADLLARRVRSDGSAPLVTCYDLGDGTRVELSATTTANWVAKTSNLLTDELLLEPGALVELDVAREHPGHWMTLVWALSCWQVGATVTLGRPDEAALLVTGPTPGAGTGGTEVVACSLHPLGLGIGDLPAGVVDFATEVRGQPDQWSGLPVTGDAPAWRDDTRSLTQQDLLAGDPADARRVLVTAGGAWETVRDALVVPLRDGGSSVVVSGTPDPARVAGIAATERVDVVLPS
ncbi:TIGR03089 family protein [Microlunatus sagamiharensis]|uniref:TIGR03089 family protein n=1 Tax=Microlunatus sagamiharensis TaxID=546874 RepID=A0A1H2LLL3_9ACTN|nr:TIGR03089 family protein [Microlunatus sagamiharensis]SDU81809.1 TIGR03089 family protein [Microlunatus sagamiharensis]